MVCLILVIGLDILLEFHEDGKLLSMKTIVGLVEFFRPPVNSFTRCTKRMEYVNLKESDRWET